MESLLLRAAIGGILIIGIPTLPIPIPAKIILPFIVSVPALLQEGHISISTDVLIVGIVNIITVVWVFSSYVGRLKRMEEKVDETRKMLREVFSNLHRLYMAMSKEHPDVEIDWNDGNGSNGSNGKR